MNNQTSPFIEQPMNLTSPTTGLYASRLTSAESPSTPQNGKRPYRRPNIIKQVQPDSASLPTEENNTAQVLTYTGENDQGTVIKEKEVGTSEGRFDTKYSHKGIRSDALENAEGWSKSESRAIPNEVSQSVEKPLKKMLAANRGKRMSEESLIEIAEQKETGRSIKESPRTGLERPRGNAENNKEESQGVRTKRGSLTRINEDEKPSISNLNRGILKETEIESFEQKYSKSLNQLPTKELKEKAVNHSAFLGEDKVAVIVPDDIDLGEKSRLLTEERRKLSKQNRGERILEHIQRDKGDGSVLENRRKSTLVINVEVEPERVAEEGEINTVALAQELRVSLPANERGTRARRHRNRQGNNAENNGSEEGDLNGDNAFDNWMNMDSRRLNEDLLSDMTIDAIVENTYYRQIGLCLLACILFIESFLVAQKVFPFQILTSTAAAVHGLGAIFSASNIPKKDWLVRKNRWRLIAVVDWLLHVQFYVILTLKLQGVFTGKLYISAIVGYSTILAYVTFAQPPPFLKMSTIISRALIWTELLLISIKIDNVTEMTWRFAFLIIWIILAVALFAVLIWSGKVFMLLVRYFKTRRIQGARSIKQPMTIALVSLFLQSVSLILLFLFLSFASHLDGPSDYRQTIKTISIVGMAYTFALFAIALILKAEITKMYRLELTDRRRANRPPVRPPVISFKSDELKNLVMFVMVSPTYFVAFDDPLLVNQQKDLVKWKQEIMKIKSERGSATSPTKPLKPVKVEELKKWGTPKRSAKEKTESDVHHKAGSYQVLDAMKGIQLTSNEEQDELLDIKLGLSMDDKDKIKDLEKVRTTTLKIETDEEGEYLCFVCYIRKANAIFMDCGHGGVCVECAQETWTKRSSCMTCRTKIKNIMKYEPIAGIDMVRAVSEIKRLVEFPQ